MKSPVPVNCPNCNSPLLPRGVHRVGVAVGVELAFLFVLAAVFVPWIWARIILAAMALALFAYTFAAAKKRGAELCPDCNIKFTSSGNS